MTYAGDFVQTAVNGDDLTGQIEQVSPCAFGYRANGLIPDNVGVRQYRPGVFQPQFGLSGCTGAAAVDDLFGAGSDTEHIALVAIGANAAPQTGDLCVAFDGTLMAYTRTNQIAALQKWQAAFKPRGVRLPAFPVLLVNASQTGSLTSAVVDDGAESTGTTCGAASILEVLTPTGPGGETALSIVVQHAASSGGPFSTLLAHTLDMTQRGAEIIIVAAGVPVNRYLRAVITMSGSTQPWAARLAFGRWFPEQG